MIKTFQHQQTELSSRDKEINAFCIDNKVFATQTNIIKNPQSNEEEILTTIFYEGKSK